MIDWFNSIEALTLCKIGIFGGMAFFVWSLYQGTREIYNEDGSRNWEVQRKRRKECEEYMMLSAMAVAMFFALGFMSI